MIDSDGMIDVYRSESKLGNEDKPVAKYHVDGIGGFRMETSNILYLGIRIQVYSVMVMLKGRWFRISEYYNNHKTASDTLIEYVNWILSYNRGREGTK